MCVCVYIYMYICIFIGLLKYIAASITALTPEGDEIQGSACLHWLNRKN